MTVDLSLKKGFLLSAEGICDVPTTKRMFRTGFQEQHFKLAPQGLKYLRLIIPIKLKAQSVPRTDHSELSYMTWTIWVKLSLTPKRQGGYTYPRRT